MNPQIIAAALSLAATLAEENEALRAQDLSGALALLDRKRSQTEAFASAQAGMQVLRRGALSPDQLCLAQSVAARLEGAAAENRRLLETAIAVQGQVIGTLLRAVPAAIPAARYGAGGARVERLTPMSLSSRA